MDDNLSTTEKKMAAIKTTKFVRKPFYVDGVQVTAEQMPELAVWCDGTIRTDDKGAQYIQVRVHRPATDRQSRAYAGDWILYMKNGYKVYTPRTMANTFDPVNGEARDAATQAEKKVPTFFSTSEERRYLEAQTALAKQQTFNPAAHKDTGIADL